jgi:hypothetical protein
MELPFDKVAPALTHPLVLIGFAVMLFFGVLRVMTSAGILPKVSRGAAGEVLRSIIKYGFILAIAVVIMGFSLEIFKVSKSTPHKSEPSPKQQATSTVLELKRRILDLRGTFETIDDFPQAAIRVQDEAIPLAERMLNIKDEKLALGHRITKYAFAGLAYVLAAEVENNADRAKAYSIYSINALDQSLYLIEEARRAADGTDKYYNDLAEWIEAGHVVNWLNYNKAIALAVKASSEGVPDRQLVETTLRKVSPTYLARYPITGNEFLSSACTQFANSGLKHLCTGGNQ